MKGLHNIDHILHFLSEVAFAALTIGASDLLSHGGGVPAACGAVAFASLLALTLISHTRLVRVCRIERAADTFEPQQGSPVSIQHEPPARSETVPNTEGTTLPEPHEDEPVGTPAVELAPRAEATAQATPATAPSRSSLDFSALCDRLVASNEPLEELKGFVGTIRTREAGGDGTRTPDDAPAPSDLELFAARMLEEAGLFSSDVELPSLSVVLPPASQAVYLRVHERHLPYLAYLRIIRIEAALNAVRFVDRYFDDPAQVSLEDAYRLNQSLARSIAAQAAPIDQIVVPEDGSDPNGEWAVRHGISLAIETLQLPYRLVARFRTNVEDGNVAIEVDLTPAEAFPTSSFVDGLGIVPTTGDMRQRASAEYALRLALLLAASAFRCSERIRHVWVAGIVSNATRRTCYYSVDFDRYRFSKLDLTDIDDLDETYRSFAPLMRYEDGWLRPVKQTFHLEEERFCPSRRYLPVSLSSRRLNGRVAESLGTDHVSGLAIEEADNRALVATNIMMRLAPPADARATERNVRTVMDLAGDDPDPTVRSAAERVVRGLVAGTLAEDALSVGEEFVRGDALTRAVDRARELLQQQRPSEAGRTLSPVLAQIDEAGTYQDTTTIAYRFFASYVQRALYNRLYAERDAGKTLILVPDAYFEAHLLMSVVNLVQGNHEAALAHSQRMVELAPLDARARLHLTKCLEELERDDEAIEQLNLLLEEAHDPQGISLGYYRMAFFQWKRGHLHAAQACYTCAMQLMPMAAPMMAMELSVLYLQNPGTLPEDPTGEQIEEALRSQGIVVAPTEHISEVFYDCARASLDAEVFPVARNFASILGAFSGDDVITGILRSLEDEPDR